MDLQQIRSAEDAALVQVGEQHQHIHRQPGQQPQEQRPDVGGASAELEKDRHLRRLPVREQLLLIPAQPADQRDCPAGELGDAAAAGGLLLQHQVDEGLGHQALKLDIGGVADVGGKAGGQLLRRGVIPPLHCGDLLRRRRRRVAVDHADPAPAALQRLVECEQVVGVGEAVLHAVLAEEEVVEKAGVAPPGLDGGLDRIQLRPLHPGVGAGREGRQRAVEPLALHLPLQVLLQPLHAEARREGAQAGGLVQPGQRGLGVHGEIRLVPAGLQQYDVRPRPGEDRQQLELVVAHIPGVEDLGQRLAPQHVDDPLELVVEPAHVLDVGVAEHVVVLPLAPHVVQSGVHGRHHGGPLPVRHPGQPLLQPLGEKARIHPEVGPHHLVEVGQVAGVRVGDAPVDDDAGAAGRLVIAAQELRHIPAVGGDPEEIGPGAAPLGEGPEAVIQLCQFRQLKHRSHATF